MAIQENLISERYENNSLPKIKLNSVQTKWLDTFLKDSSIRYEEVSNCPLCDSTNAILIAKKDRYGIPLKTVVCENCGLVRSYNQLTEASQKLFYKKYYRNIYEELETHLELINERYKKERLSYVPKYLSKEDVVVEIGCGGGWNLIPYHKNDYAYYGFDYDETFIELGKSKGLNLYVGDTEETSRMGIKADYVILNQVLEHVKNPIIFLKELKKILNANAIVSIWVPSLDLIPYGYARGDLFGTLQIAHNYLFDEYTLKKVGLTAGYKIINCLGANLILKNSNVENGVFLEKDKIQRGVKVVRYLKFTEAILPLRKFLKTDKILSKELYYLTHPIQAYRKLLIRSRGTSEQL